MAVDYSKFSKEELIKYIEELQNQLKSEKYGLYWDKTIDKEEAATKCKTQIPIFFRETNKCILSSLGTNNVLVEGDNYHALLSLQFVMKESIDTIYIDPPYNTGSNDFRYNDNFINSDDGFLHSKWLSFIEKRLILCRNLLKNDGVIFISIDDNEQANLKLLCDQIFGTKNFLANLVVISAPAGTQSAVGFATQQSYCLVYQKSAEYVVNNVKTSKECKTIKYNYGSDNLGSYYIERIWKRGEGGKKEDVPSLHFPVYFNPVTKQILIDKEIELATSADAFIKIIPYHTAGVLGRWTWSREKMINERDHLIVVKVAGKWKLHKKVYEIQDKGRRPFTIIDSKLGRTELGSLEIKEVLGNKAFPYPKYSKFIEYLVSLQKNDDAVVLDCFAGSGTTGQAVLELNKEDGGHRRFILCTNNENNICTDVTYPRLKTVITGIRPDGSKYSDGIPANLIYYKTDFIPSSKNSDQAKYCLVEKVDELLCISEDIFVSKSRNDYSSHYASNDGKRHMFIFSDYFDNEKFNQFKREVLSVDGEKIVYMFSLDNTIDETLFGANSGIELKPIPSKIYEIYKEIVESIKRGE